MNVILTNEERSALLDIMAQRATCAPAYADLLDETLARKTREIASKHGVAPADVTTAIVG